MATGSRAFSLKKGVSAGRMRSVLTPDPLTDLFLALPQGGW